MKKQVIIFSMFFTVLIVSCSFASDFDSYKTLHEARVLSITDGDTISIRFVETPQGCSRIEKVRLIGIDTPELFTKPSEYFAQEAKYFTTEMLLNKDIYIEFDNTGLRDYYGRLLAYVRLSNTKEIQKDFEKYVDIKPITSALNNNTFLYNEAIILAGYSYYYGKYTFDEKYMKQFASAEEMAELLKLGLWK